MARSHSTSGVRNGVSAREALVTAFQMQSGLCRHFGSDFYADLMQKAGQDADVGGPVARLLEGWPGDPVRGFLPLRLFGAVHERVLAGHAPELARFYPTAGGRVDAEGAWPFFLGVLVAQAEAIRPQLESFPQTNEVLRCAGLLGGFLEIAGRTGLPLRLREIGCSAGLNLQWSRYAYVLGSHAWGDPTSPVQIRTEWSGPPPRLDASPGVESRAGCDLDPSRLDDPAAVRKLEAYVWPDQPQRLERLRAALRLARADPPRVEVARAQDWLPPQLEAPADGVCRVVFHSSVWIYLEQAERVAIRSVLSDCGGRATPDAPLAWLRHEDGEVPGRVEIRLTLWPGAEERLLGLGHPHGRAVEWQPA